VTYWFTEQERRDWAAENDRAQQLRAHFKEFGGTGKELSAKFNLKLSKVYRVTGAVRKEREQEREQREQAALYDSLRQKTEEIERMVTGRNFTAVAERLWMDLAWLRMALEQRKTCSERVTP